MIFNIIFLVLKINKKNNFNDLKMKKKSVARHTNVAHCISISVMWKLKLNFQFCLLFTLKHKPESPTPKRGRPGATKKEAAPQHCS